MDGLTPRAGGALEFNTAKARVGALATSALLAMAGGFLDGFTYVGHGHVFANAMTGNVVLLGISSVSGTGYSAFRHLPAICAFLLGTCVAQAIQLGPKRRRVAVPYAAVLLGEIVILMGVSLLPATMNNLWITTTIAFTASVQVSTFREVNGQNYSSTFTSGNLRTLGEAAFSWWFEGRGEQPARVLKDFSVIVVAFLLGATCGGYTTHAFGNRALWVDVGLFVVILLMVRRKAGAES